MPAFFQIYLIVLGGLVTFLFTLLFWKIDRNARKTEERQRQIAQDAAEQQKKLAQESEERQEQRQQELIICRTIEMQYTRSIGSMAHYTAKKVKDAVSFPIANGDLADAIKYYKAKEHELEDFYQKQSVVNNVRGG